MNKSGLEPRGRAVLVEMIGAVRARPKNSLIVMPEVVKEAVDMVDQMATVLAIGPSCWHDEPKPRAEVGETVLITKFAGMTTKGVDGKRYRFINDRDIFGVILQQEEIQEVANG